MKHVHHPQRLSFGAVLIALVVATAALAQTGQISQVENRGVQKRMALMNINNTALGTLTDMMGGRAFFDKARARAARRSLISATGDIPSVFRKQHTDPLSRARPEVWLHWRDFKDHAKAAQRAARRLDIDSLPDLRQTLPSLISACLQCHRSYRKPM
ncbi:cytochrome c [Sedimentitalea nanhaiensis]|uniref:Cytochrome c556 n=1 Tax=Sedimentitalea nanhaiensis TaxID=999627 RepID=A0A1I7CTI4_9RHOB|nr:cytochrome c [Sedimentitalea nanhaiensis]SFU02733.1 Cytochrome c556 [Sedimentitalea nanhaiensis]